MKYEIWKSSQGNFVFTSKLSVAEAIALRDCEYTCEHEYEAITKENAEAYFVGWVDNMGGFDDVAEKHGADAQEIQ